VSPLSPVSVKESFGLRISQASYDDLESKLFWRMQGGVRNERQLMRKLSVEGADKVKLSDYKERKAKKK